VENPFFVEPQRRGCGERGYSELQPLEGRRQGGLTHRGSEAACFTPRKAKVGVECELHEQAEVWHDGI
jgi:hypothetical protein